MPKTVAELVAELRNLEELTRQKQAELDAEISKLRKERDEYLALAAERDQELGQLLDKERDESHVRLTSLAATLLSQLPTSGGKTLGEITAETGFKKKSVSQCLLALVRKNQVSRWLPEGRIRGALYSLSMPIDDPVAFWGTKSMRAKAAAKGEPVVEYAKTENCTFSNDKTPKPAEMGDRPELTTENSK